MKFFREGAVAAIALGVLVSAAGDESPASSNAIVGLLVFSTAITFAALAALLPKLLLNFTSTSAAIVLSETILVFDLLNKLQVPFSNFFLSSFF